MAIIGWEWIVIFVGIIVGLWLVSRMLRRRPPQKAPPYSAAPSPATVIREREVVKEIVMVPCRYCGGLMPQTSVF